jgi:hypothetical protein
MLSTDLWSDLDQTALDLLHAEGGALTVDTTDHSRRKLLLALDRLVRAGAVAKVLTDGPLETYRLLGTV